MALLANDQVIFRFEDFELDEDRLELRHWGELVKADALVLRLLLILVRNTGRLVTKDELVREVWEGRAVADNAITVAMSRLRKTLSDRCGARECVRSVYGRGYRFACAVTSSAELRADWTARDELARLPAFARLSAAGVIADDEDAPLVGRERTLQRLRRALKAANGGRGRACLLLGEPGIGKSKLLESFEADAQAQARVVWGFCRQAGDERPLRPFLRILRELATDPESAREPAALSASSLLSELESDSHGNRPGRCFDAILNVLAEHALRAPLVIVLEDLERADAASLQLLGLLLDEISRTRMLVLAATRIAGRGPAISPALARVLSHRNCDRIGVERLSPEQVARYVGALVPDPGGELGAAVFANSEGIPFFMVELARTLQHADKPRAEALGMPRVAREGIRQRIAELRAETRSVLSAACVIGRTFDLPLLAAALHRDPTELMTNLDEAVGADVLGTVPESATAFTFGHELFRTVLYEDMSSTERRRWHLAVGHALEQRLQDGATTTAELAHHFHAALPEGDLNKTLQVCRDAATASAAALENREVVRHARHAVETLDLMEITETQL